MTSPADRVRRPRRLLGVGAAAVLVATFGIGAASAPADDDVASKVLFSFADPDINESSGLVARDGVVVTVNDSGDSNRIFTVDPAGGETVGVTRFSGEAVDIEALAPADDGEVWVADIGDNLGRRDTVRVTRVPFGSGERQVPGTGYDLVYPDGAHDAETLLVHPETGRLYVVAKEFIGRLYAAPETLSATEPNELEPVGSVLGIATDGAFLPDGRHLLLRNYGQAAVYTWPDLERLATFALPAQKQGEGLAVAEDGSVLLSSEGVDAEVLRIELPAEVREQLAAAEPTEPAEPSGSPDTDATGGATDGSQADGDSGTSLRDVLLSPWVVGGGLGLLALALLVRAARSTRREH
ncbi:hypothetical protein KG112_03630 [Nocardioides sp. zg-ZUI104]|uniref:hypothetical protein n=1 Tax=Nocardioides faecalis TaxID=2803858 RepID=UPI001BD007C8|nr:hypothetical protein [Nocardioides faecalis]MBS4751898.1 hypothetical protein [Nocardioides faecalis]